jgi:hypothetical protein
MAIKASTFGFTECADLISEQKYGAALKVFNQAIGRLLEAKSSPKRSEVALQLLQIATALEETLKKAYGEKWETYIPRFAEEDKQADCSFCGKEQSEVRKLIAGLSVHICDECVNLCSGIIAQEGEHDAEANAPSKSSKGSADEHRLCGICMEARETDELVFLPHAAYLCAECLEEMMAIRDKQSGK